VSTPVALGVAVALLLVNGVFVAAEFALLASRRSRLEQHAAAGAGGARQALAATRQLSLMLAGAQLGITMASIGLGAVAEPAIAHLFEDLFEAIGVPEGLRHGIAFAIALSIVVFLHIVVGEMAPKSWAIADPERAALVLARPFRAFVLVLRPVIWLLNRLANGVVRLCGVTPQDERAMAHSAADLSLLLRDSVEEGAIDQREVELFTRALDLSGLQADSAMTPREQIVYVPADATVGEVEEVFRRSGFSRLLVVGGHRDVLSDRHDLVNLDDLVGVVHVRDVLLLDPSDRAKLTAGALARPVSVGYENQALEDLLLAMRSERRRWAVLVDDLGSVCGLVTLQGLLSTLVGRST
jgi:CBS domain containing-hemolysin-like protein